MALIASSLSHTQRSRCWEGSQAKLRSKSKTRKSSKKPADAPPQPPPPPPPLPPAPPLSSTISIKTPPPPPNPTASASPPKIPPPTTTFLHSMEVEVKLRLPDSTAHKYLHALLSPFHVITHRQYNTFFDGAAAELSSKRAVLRLRFYNDDSKCVVSLKAKAVLINGVSRVEEDEEDIDPLIGRECLAEPALLGSVELRLVKRAKEEFGVTENGFVCLGGFKNVRNVYEWNGLKLELDETKYDFGTLYEIECESVEPDKAKELIEQFLKENGIEYSYSEASKFAIFRSGKLP